MLLYIGIIALALIIRPFSRKTCLSYPAILVIFGCAMAAFMRAQNFDMTFHSENFKTIVLYLFLPTLIFQLAYKTPLEKFTEKFGSILFLAIIGMAVSLLCIAVVFHYFSPGDKWLGSFMVASLLAGVSATALLDTLRKFRVENTSVMPLLRWEALLSSVFAVSILNIIFEYVMAGSGESVTASYWIVEFFEEAGGGIFIGMLVGGLSLGILMMDHDPGVQTFVTIVSVYFGYILSQDVLGVSGVMAVATQGLLYSNLAKPLNSEATRNFVGRFWGMSNLVVYTCSFLLAGVMLDYSVLMQHWLTIVALAATVIVVRAAIMYGLLPIWKCGVPRSDIASDIKPVIFWGGTRGAVAVVLALAIPSQLPHAATIQTIIFGVITLGLLLQIPLSCLSVRRLQRLLSGKSV